MNSTDSRKIVFFNRWTHEEGLALIKFAPDVEVRQLNWDAPEQDSWAELASAHGYQISSARHEKYHLKIVW